MKLSRSEQGKTSVTRSRDLGKTAAQEGGETVNGTSELGELIPFAECNVSVETSARHLREDGMDSCKRPSDFVRQQNAPADNQGAMRSSASEPRTTV